MTTATTTTTKAPCTIIGIGKRPEGTNYLVKVPDTKNPRGYDLVDVLVHDNGARSIKSTARSTTTPFHAGRAVTAYLAAPSHVQAAMRGHS